MILCPTWGNTGKHIRLREIRNDEIKPHHHQELDGGPESTSRVILKETLDRGPRRPALPPHKKDFGTAFSAERK